MKKTLLLFTCFVLIKLVYSQEYLGYANSNNAGITGVWLQPASIADSRYKADIHLAGFNFNFNNNFFLYDARILSLKDSLFDDPLFYDNRITERDLKGNDFSFNLSTDMQLLSFLFAIDTKNTIGFGIRHRFNFQVEGVEDDLLQLAMEEFDYPDLMNRSILNRELSIQLHNWMEYDLHYARVLMDDNEHFLKGGVTLKILQGLGSLYIYSNELRYNFSDNDTISITESDLSYGWSDKMRSNADNFNSSNLFKNESSSIGFDLGFVYEYRPEYYAYKYDMDGSYNLWRNDQSKYKFKAGVSLLDVGRIKYNKGADSRDWTVDVRLMDLSDLSGVNTIAELTDSLTNRFSDSTSGNSYNMQLPTVLSTQFDFQIQEGFYLNFTPFWGFQRNSNKNKTHAVSRYSLTPRWEHRWFDVGLPIHYDQYQNFGIGMSVRLGPFITGFNNLKNVFKRGNSGEFEFYTAFKIPIKYPIPMDDDGDGVSDKFDLCPDEAGTLENNGCPDRDKDGVPDRLDYCPDESGLKKYNGCPDSDLDGIINHNDECPYEVGPRYTNGCPDSDLDSIPDKTDHCPQLAGPIEYMGCPDTDGDGVTDPNDECPKTPGPKSNNGCPTLSRQEQEVINAAFGNLEFETKKSIIKNQSFYTLDKLAERMQKNSEWYLRLSGHTDAIGTEEFNLQLSENRAHAVRDYLLDKGLSERRFIIQFFGESDPIADNKTEVGKQLNRRVEMKILFE